MASDPISTADREKAWMEDRERVLNSYREEDRTQVWYVASALRARVVELEAALQQDRQTEGE